VQDSILFVAPSTEIGKFLQVKVTNEFLGTLLDIYGDGPGFDLMPWLFVRGDSFHRDLQHFQFEYYETWRTLLLRNT
jgi:hypothetical protein